MGRRDGRRGGGRGVLSTQCGVLGAGLPIDAGGTVRTFTAGKVGPRLEAIAVGFGGNPLAPEWRGCPPKPQGAGLEPWAAAHPLPLFLASAPGRVWVGPG